MDEHRSEEVVAMLEEQAELFNRLESLAGRQQSLVEMEDTGPLLNLLSQRQQLSTRLTGIASRLEPVRKDWPAYRHRLSEEQRARAEQLLDESRKCLQRIMEEDERDARILAARKQVVAQSLRGAHDTGQAMSAYRTPLATAGAPARFDEAS